jgi:hypothetical protein
MSWPGSIGSNIPFSPLPLGSSSLSTNISPLPEEHQHKLMMEAIVYLVTGDTKPFHDDISSIVSQFSKNPDFLLFQDELRPFLPYINTDPTEAIGRLLPLLGITLPSFIPNTASSANPFYTEFLLDHLDFVNKMSDDWIHFQETKDPKILLDDFNAFHSILQDTIENIDAFEDPDLKPKKDTYKAWENDLFGEQGKMLVFTYNPTEENALFFFKELGLEPTPPWPA